MRQGFQRFQFSQLLSQLGECFRRQDAFAFGDHGVEECANDDGGDAGQVFALALFTPHVFQRSSSIGTLSRVSSPPIGSRSTMTFTFWMTTSRMMNFFRPILSGRAFF